MSEFFDFVSQVSTYKKSPASINTNQQIEVFKYHDSFICVTQSNFYQCFSDTWELIQDTPFSCRPGQSVTSSGTELFVFGGVLPEGVNSHELWVYQNESWHPIYNDIPPRKYHGSVYIPTISSILISGGYDESETKILSDFVLLNLGTLSTKVLKLQDKLEFARHSLTFLHDTKVCLFGGVSNNNVANEFLYIIDVQTGDTEVIDVYTPFRPTFPHLTTYIDNMLIVTTTGVIFETWAFDLQFSIWLKLDLNCGFSDTRFVFSNSNGFTLFNSKLDQSTTVEYIDINRFKDRILTANINSDLYKFDDDTAIENYKSLVDAHRASLLHLKNLISHIHQINDSSIFEQMQIDKDFVDLHFYQSQIENLMITHKTEEKQVKTTNKTATQLLEEIKSLRSNKKADIQRFSKYLSNPSELIQTYNHNHVLNCPKELINNNNTNEPNTSLVHKSKELSEKIKKQNQKIKELSEVLQSEKSKHESFYFSLIKLTEQLDKCYENYYHAQTDHSKLISEYIKNRIKMNNIKLDELFDEKADRVDAVNKRRELKAESKKLQEQLQKCKETKQEKLNQLAENLKVIISMAMVCDPTTGENMCLKARSSLMELSAWLNNNSKLIGSTNYVNIINFEKANLNALKSRKSKRNIPVIKKPTQNIVEREGWRSLAADILSSLKELSENHSI